MKIYFYPHAYLRDRHLDTIRRWHQDEVINPELAKRTRGEQVSEQTALSGKIRRSWKQKLPLVNFKLRPKEAPNDAVIYVWGGLIANGKFIVDLDNPYSLVAYNPSAMMLWKHLIAHVLCSPRCLQIRCISEACQAAVGELFGKAAFAKSVVVYPRLNQEVHRVVLTAADGPRFLFIGTQFLIKGGPELLEAFRKVRQKIPTARLDLVTHLPEEYQLLAQQEGVQVHKANLSRAEVWAQFMQKADVLVHPSYMESFGMVVLEALSHGLAVIANDVYAHREMVLDGKNGRLLQPPVYYWNGVLAGPLFWHQFDASTYIRQFEKSVYINQLADAMITVVQDKDRLLSYRNNSCSQFNLMMGQAPQKDA